MCCIRFSTLWAVPLTFTLVVLPVPEDLTPEEQQELENIRRRKQELLEDIQVTLAWNLERNCSMYKNVSK